MRKIEISPTERGFGKPKFVGGSQRFQFAKPEIAFPVFLLPISAETHLSLCSRLPFKKWPQLSGCLCYTMHDCRVETQKIN